MTRFRIEKTQHKNTGEKMSFYEFFKKYVVNDNQFTPPFINAGTYRKRDMTYYDFTLLAHTHGIKCNIHIQTIFGETEVSIRVEGSQKKAAKKEMAFIRFLEQNKDNVNADINLQMNRYNQNPQCDWYLVNSTGTLRIRCKMGIDACTAPENLWDENSQWILNTAKSLGEVANSWIEQFVAR